MSRHPPSAYYCIISEYVNNTLIVVSAELGSCIGDAAAATQCNSFFFGGHPSGLFGFASHVACVNGVTHCEGELFDPTPLPSGNMGYFAPFEFDFGTNGVVTDPRFDCTGFQTGTVIGEITNAANLTCSEMGVGGPPDFCGRQGSDVLMGLGLPVTQAKVPFSDVDLGSQGTSDMIISMQSQWNSCAESLFPFGTNN